MIRLVLFDLDGTLVRSRKGFIPFNEAIEKTFGLTADIRTVVPDGNTDPLILEEIFSTANLQVEITRAAWETFARNLRESYRDAISRGLTRIVSLPGVLDLVGELARTEEVHQGVVTGNLEATARLKLEAAGLGPYLRLGAFGSDSRDRVDLPRIARERWARAIGGPIAPDHCIIVGDTPKDLAAARSNRMKCLLVGTGRYPVEELELYKPEAVLPDLTDTDLAVDTIIRLA